MCNTMCKCSVPDKVLTSRLLDRSGSWGLRADGSFRSSVKDYLGLPAFVVRVQGRVARGRRIFTQ